MYLEDKINKLKETVFKEIVGNYGLGAGKNVAYLEGITTKELGETICSFGKETPSGYSESYKFTEVSKSNSFIHRLAEYAYEEIDDMVQSVTLTNKTVSEKYDIIVKSIRPICNKLYQEAFAEGSIDDELKEDISLLLKEGKEKFQERNKEALDKNMVVEEAEAPQQTEQQMAYEEPIGQQEEPQEQQVDMNDDLGFNNPLGDDFGNFNDNTPNDGIGDADPKEMAQFASFDVLNNPIDLSLTGLTTMVNKMKMQGYSEKAICETFDEINMTTLNKADQRYYHKGTITTIAPNKLNEMVNLLLAGEQEVHDNVALQENAKILTTDAYGQYSKLMVNTMTVALATRHRLDI